MNIQTITQRMIALEYCLEPIKSTWLRSNQYYVGRPEELKQKLEQELKGELPPLHQHALLQQLEQLESRTVKASLENIDPSPRDPFVPKEAVECYISEQLYARSRQLTEQVQISRTEEGELEVRYRSNAPEKYLNFMTRYLTGQRRRSDERDEYLELDERFATWLAQSKWRTETEDNYHKRYASLGSHWPTHPYHLEIEGWNEAVVPHAYQLEEVSRALELGGGINAFGVGLGKTLTSIVLVFTLLERGLIQRPMIVVPKSLISKWRKEILKAVPRAKILTMGAEAVYLEDGEILLDEHNAEVWNEVIGAAALGAQLSEYLSGEHQICLITYETFERIQIEPLQRLELIQSAFASLHDAPFAKGTLSNTLFSEYAGLKAQSLLESGQLTLEDLAAADERLKKIKAELEQKVGEDAQSSDSSTRAQKAEEREYNQFLSRANRILSSTKHNTLNLPWHQLAVDFLVVDEAHNYKNLWVRDRATSVKYLGAPSDSSLRALDLYFKSAELHARMGKGIYLLTATPLTNSPLELFNLCEYLGRNPFREAGIQNLLQFMERYCNIDYFLQGEKQVPFLKNFKNLNELRSLCFQHIQRKTALDVQLKLPRSEADYQIFLADDLQQTFLDEILETPRESIEKYLDKVPEENENEQRLQTKYRLSIMYLLQRAEMDLEMLEPQLYRGYISPKVQAWLEQVREMVEEGGKGIVFCEMLNMPNPSNRDKPNPHGYTFHEKLVSLVVKYCGLTRHQIGVCNAKAAPDPESRMAIQDRFNGGTYRLVIGNSTMGEGMDLQVDCTHLWHLTLPWNPAKLEQYEGRPVRQGNTQARVHNRFLMGSSGLDPMMMDLMRGKKSWYDAFWTGHNDEMDTPAQQVIPSLKRIQALRIRDLTERFQALAEIEAEERTTLEIAERQELQKRLRKIRSADQAFHYHQSKHPQPTELQAKTRAEIKKGLEDQKAKLLKSSAWNHGAGPLEKPFSFVYDPVHDRLIRMGDLFGVTKSRYQVWEIDWKTETVTFKISHLEAIENPYQTHALAQLSEVMKTMHTFDLKAQVLHSCNRSTPVPGDWKTYDSAILEVIEQAFLSQWPESENVLVYRENKVQFIPIKGVTQGEILFPWHPHINQLLPYLNLEQHKLDYGLEPKQLEANSSTPHYFAQKIKNDIGYSYLTKSYIQN